MKQIVLSIVLVVLTINVILFAEEPNPQSEFGFNLYRTVVKSEPDKNIAVSPYGVQKLLDLARYGAAGETKTEIEQVLGYTQPVKWETLSDGTLSIAAALWTQQGLSILPEFLQTARERFGSSIEQTDFANTQAAVRQINAWCAEKTKERIPTLFSDLSPQTRLILANAIHFAADWKTPFEESMTRDGDFTLQEGTKVKTKMMGLFDKRWKYSEQGDTLSLELPYKVDGYAMILLLAKEPADFAKWESEMTTKKFNLLRRSMEVSLVDIRMPKFTMESNITLNEILEHLGMPRAFDPLRADFSKITTAESFFVGKALQKTFIKVDELGTEAAAVTVMTMGPMAIPDPPKPKLFYADRPFLYAIVKGDAILFLGRFVKPDPPTESVVPAVPPDLAQARTWTAKTGQTIDGEFVKLEGDTVSIKLPDGRLAQIKLDLLSEEDQQFVLKGERKAGDRKAGE